ncbi:nuclear transport factor 2 family protein [Mycobacterium sp. 236(2023)]|uniref:nuclear transport factor 2 family protein n=1 Tax=Mycobacterium sp. 236(2023) TaxID=3038163 RepID=UPI0024155735|nr:nuclear transport factor 2 family protein [Mycobacterium sp. 236(2023)]MDG4668144.1 nuclear transport factor 2 family protein [Mycobacterium sp. 236(2023)]
MVTVLTHEQLSSLDIVTINQILVQERQARDRGWWSQMLTFFHDDSRVTISWFDGSGADFVASSRALAEQGAVGCHRLEPPAIHVHQDRAVAVMPVVVETYPTVEGVGTVLTGYARLVYQLERRSGTWGIVRMQAIYERDELHSTPAASAPLVPADELKAFRPSYAWLAWSLNRLGLRVPADLPGDDKPSLAEALYDNAFAWITE